MKRTSIVFWALMGCFLCVLARLIDMQLINDEKLRAKADNQSICSVKLAPWRGTIYDRNAKELAISVVSDSICAWPRSVNNHEQVSEKLAMFLDVDAKVIAGKLRSERRFVWIKRKAGMNLRGFVDDMTGIGIVEESKRCYPRAGLAAHVLGFSGMDNKGLEGIEFAFDEYLRGASGCFVSVRDAKGREISTLRQGYKRARQGKGLVLTIDETIQCIVEEELDSAYLTNGAKEPGKITAKAVMVVVMDPLTGEILAMAGKPGFEPENFQESTAEERRNRAVADVFEPGSCFKAVTAAAALEEGLFVPDDTIDCEDGAYRVYGHTIHDVHGHKSLSFKNVFVKSSNIGASKIASAVGEMKLYSYIRAFGFGEKTNCGLPGETAGLLRKPDDWSKLSIYTLSFGQGIAVNAVQLISAFSAIANGGVLMQPMIVKAIVNSNGNVLKVFKPQETRRVVSGETAGMLSNILTGVVEEGTGQRAALPGYSVAGKTGTAQKIAEDGTYSHSKFVSSFIGYAPAKHPCITVLVLVDEPAGKPWQCYGGSVAGPVFGKIAARSLKYLGIPPDGIRKKSFENPILASKPERKKGVCGFLAIKNNKYYRGQAHYGKGNYLALEGSCEPVTASVCMPDLSGMTMRQVVRTLDPYELTIKFQGSGIAVGQVPEKGTGILPGKKCLVTFAQSSATPEGQIQ